MRDIKKVKDDAFEKASDIMENKFLNLFKTSTHPAESELEEHSRRVDQLTTLASALSASLKGIENLNATYKDDATTLSILGIMYTEIEEKVIAIKSKIESAHYKYVGRAAAANASFASATIPSVSNLLPNLDSDSEPDSD